MLAPLQYVKFALLLSELHNFHACFRNSFNGYNFLADKVPSAVYLTKLALAKDLILKFIELKEGSVLSSFGHKLTPLILLGLSPKVYHSCFYRRYDHLDGIYIFLSIF